MAAMSVGAGIVVGSLFLSQIRHPVLNLKNLLAQKQIKTYLYLSLFLALACAVSLIFADLFPFVVAGKKSHVHFLKDMAKALYLFWPIVLVLGLSLLSAQQKKRLLHVWLIAFTLISAIGVAQYFTGWPRMQVIPSHPNRFHVIGFLGHHLSFANIFIFPFFVALEIAFQKHKAFAWVSIFLGLLALFGTYSRILWVALPIGILLYGALSLPKKYLIVFATVIVLAVWGAWRLPFISERMKDSLGVATRQDLWAANFVFFKQRPLTGVGWHHNLELSGFYLESKYKGASVFSGHAHNNFIEMLASLGILGLFAWILWCIFILKIAWSSSRGLFCAWIVFHINGLTQVNFWESKVLHQMMWVTALSLLWTLERKQNVAPKT